MSCDKFEPGQALVELTQFVYYQELKELRNILVNFREYIASSFYYVVSELIVELFQNIFPP